MLLCGRENEDCIRGRFFKGLQKGIEGRLAQHVYLVNDINLVATKYRSDADLLNERTNILDTIVTSCVKLKDIE